MYIRQRAGDGPSWAFGGRRLPTIMIGARRYVTKAALEAFLIGPDQATPSTTVDQRNRAEAASRHLDAHGFGAT